MLLNPISVALGHNGNSVTRLYWASKSPDDSSHSSSDNATRSTATSGWPREAGLDSRPNRLS